MKGLVAGIRSRDRHRGGVVLLTCVRCGAELAPPFQFCERCGAPQGLWWPGPAYPPSQKQNHTVLIIVVVVFLVSIPVLAAVLYVMTSGLVHSAPLESPVVTFGSLSVTARTVTFEIAGASPVVALSSYKFNLILNGIPGLTASTLAPGSNSITAAGTSFWVNYTDVSGNGNLKSGDILRIQAQPAGAFLPSGSFVFVLIWASDGSMVQSQQWNV